MKISKIAATALIVCGLTATPAHAAVYTFNFNLGPTPNADLNPITPQNNQIHNRVWLLNGLFDPFNLAAGDQVVATVYFSAPVTIVNTPSSFGNAQFAAFNFSSSTPASGWTWSASTSTDFSGTSGDFVGDPSPLIAGQGSNSSFQGFGGSTGVVNLTNSTMTFTSVSMLIDVLSIPAQTAPFTFGSFQIIDQVRNLSVPTPGALALLGLGLTGLGVFRRRKLA